MAPRRKTSGTCNKTFHRSLKDISTTCHDPLARQFCHSYLSIIGEESLDVDLFAKGDVLVTTHYAGVPKVHEDLPFRPFRRFSCYAMVVTGQLQTSSSAVLPSLGDEKIWRRLLKKSSSFGHSSYVHKHAQAHRICFCSAHFSVWVV